VQEKPVVESNGIESSCQRFSVHRITPYEWSNPHPCKSDPDELETDFTASNALWFGIGSFLCQGSDILPKAISTRMVAGMWWFFTLIMISSYTANLAAFLTAAKMDSPVNSAEDLAKQTKIKYGTYCCGSTNAFFQSSTIPTYQKLNAFMESAKPSVYTATNGAGIERVRKEDGMYAFFMEGASIEYNVERKCDLTQIGGLLDSKGYGVALPPGSPYTRAISAGILALQEKGILQKLKIKWWKEMHGGGQCVSGGEGASSAQLGLPNLGGVFIVLTGGMIVSCFIAVLEFMWENRKMASDPTKSVWAECWKEFKFAIDIRAGDTKPVEKEEDSNDGSSSSSSSDSKSEDHYGVIHEDHSKATTHRHKTDDSAYAVFTEPSRNGKKH